MPTTNTPTAAVRPTKERPWCEDCRFYATESDPVRKQPCGCVLCRHCVAGHDELRLARGDGHGNE